MKQGQIWDRPEIRPIRVDAYPNVASDSGSSGDEDSDRVRPLTERPRQQRLAFLAGTRRVS